MYDAIVVGARCAGAPTAMLLGRMGYKVLLLDRSSFPSDIPHGHLIHRKGPQRLQQWGLLDRIVATGAPQVTSMTHDVGSMPLSATNLEASGVGIACGPRRSALDMVLVEAAVEAGVEFRDQFVVDEYLADGAAITGVAGHHRASNRPVTEHARITVGADGRSSLLARTVGAQDERQATPSLTCWYWTYWSETGSDSLEVHDLGDCATFSFPTNDGLLALFVVWPHAMLETVKPEISRHYMEVVDRIPSLSERIRSGHQEERFRGFTDLPNFVRRPYGEGWALVGDAGCHKDPYLALGICDAFRDAELLANAIDDGLSGRQPMTVALAEYGRLRNEATDIDYERNIGLARFQPPPAEQLQLRAALQRDPEGAHEFLMAAEGMIPPEQFFNPANLGRIMAGAARRQGEHEPLPV